MSLTLINRLYEHAKEESEAAALKIFYDGTYHELPWWYLKTKVKHFGLGLLQEGAQLGDYFYLFPSPHPHWIFAELGALTVGLTTLPLPQGVSPTALQELFDRYPPSFIFLGNQPLDSLLPHLKHQKNLHRIILTEAKNKNTPSPLPHPPSTFREVFNLGIRQETRQHALYRQIREQQNENHILTPVWVDAEGKIIDFKLSFGDINQWATSLTHLYPSRKLKKFFVEVDLSHTLERILGLYWPLFTRILPIFFNEVEELTVQLKTFRPEIAYFRESSLRALLRPFSGEISNAIQGKNFLNPGFLEKFRAGRKIKNAFGDRLRTLWLISELEAESIRLLKSAKVRPIIVRPDLGPGAEAARARNKTFP